ncbi:hypothetical protein Tco_1502356 [Tanacetum coccineum]
MWSQVPIVYDKHALWGISHWGRKCQQFYGFGVNRESACDVYSRNRILAVTKLKINEWHNYKNLDWITVRRNDDKLYTFKEGDYNRLRLQDIEDMMLLLVQGKLTNLNIEERLDQISNFSDGTLNDVRSALDDILKRIQMKYLPQTVWRNVDNERAGAMMQAIDQQLRNKRIIRSLERFVGGRPYKGDLRLLERTIWSILTDLKVTPTKHGRMTKPYSSPRFIANCFILGIYKDGHGGFAVHVFSLGGDLNACLNKEMAFLMVVASSRFLSTNNQLRTSSNLRNQATIQDDMVTVQNTEDLDTYDSDCDDISYAKSVLMANISNYGSDVISKVPHSETYLNDMENQSVHAMQDFEQTPAMDVTDNEITSDSNIIPCSQYLQETQQTNVQDTNWQAHQDSMILSMIKQMSNK